MIKLFGFAYNPSVHPELRTTSGVMRERTAFQVDRVVVQNTSRSTFWKGS